jgi:Rieske Fe-S protein
VDPAGTVPESARANPLPDGGVEDAGAGDVPTVLADVDPCATGFDVGLAAQFALNTWTRLEARGLIVARDAMGLFAYSARCPHQGCVVDAPAAGTGQAVCACHGSRFDGNGRVLNGPARANLPHYAMRLCGGRVRVDAEEVVDITTRTRAP